MDRPGWMPEFTKEGLEIYLDSFNSPALLKNINILCSKLVDTLGSEADKSGQWSQSYGTIKDELVQKSLIQKAEGVALHLCFVSAMLNTLRDSIAAGEKINDPIFLEKSKEKSLHQKEEFISEGDKLERGSFGIAVVMCGGLVEALLNEEYDYFLDWCGQMLDENFNCVHIPDSEFFVAASQLLFFFYVRLAPFLPVGINFRMDCVLGEISWSAGVLIREMQERAYQHNLNVKLIAGRQKGIKASNRDLIENAIFRMDLEKLRAMDAHPYARAAKIREFMVEKEHTKALADGTIISHWNAIAEERGWK